MKTNQKKSTHALNPFNISSSPSLTFFSSSNLRTATSSRKLISSGSRDRNCADNLCEFSYSSCFAARFDASFCGGMYQSLMLFPGHNVKLIRKQSVYPFGVQSWKWSLWDLRPFRYTKIQRQWTTKEPIGVRSTSLRSPLHRVLLAFAISSSPLPNFSHRISHPPL
jgi:hypothetical protein